MVGPELIKTIGEESLKVAGLTAVEAASKMGYTALADGTLVKNVIRTTAGEVIEFPTATASEAASQAGALVSEAAESTTANLTLIEGADGATSVGGILSISAPVAASILAAVGGYLIGNQLYKNYPEFFDKITGPLMQYLADGTVDIMTIIDSHGNTYMDQRAYDDLLSKLGEMSGSSSSGPGSNVPLGTISMTPTCDLFKALMNDYMNAILTQSIAEPICDINTELGYLYNCCNAITSIYPNCVIFVELTMEPEGHYYYPEFLICREATSSGSVYMKGDYKYLKATGDFYFNTFQDSPTPIDGKTPDATFPSPLSSSSQFFLYWTKFFGANNLDSCDWPMERPGGSTLWTSNVSYTTDSSLPDDIKKYSPPSATLSPITVHRVVDGCPQELPFIPVRIPKNPTIIPFPNPDENPNENDPNEDPDKYNPIITPTPVYPPDIPTMPVKPKPDQSDKPEKHPIVLPDPTNVPSPTPNKQPDPNNNPSEIPDPSTIPVPDPVVPTPPDPVPNPNDNGKTPTPITPVIPPVSTSAAGLLHVYNPTASQVTQFGAWLWTTFSGSMIDTISKLFNNPMDAVIGLHELYATPSDGDSMSIRAGYLDSGITSRLVKDRYTSINCGSIVIQEHWGNYLDYSPYTKTYCYLPFIGIVELQTDDIIAHAVNITYKIDSYTGSCIAIISVAKDGYESITYQFSGNCSVEIPITSGMKATMQNALIGAATSGILALSGGGAGAAIAGAALSGGIRRGINSKNEVQHSGSFGATFGAMGIKKPFIIVKRPKQKVVPGYNENYGYPAHKMVALSECSGYTRVREVDVISVTATEEEKKLIETMLKEGIFVS